MPPRNRNKKQKIDLRTSHFRSKNRDTVEKVVNILRELNSDESKPWSQHSLTSVSEHGYPFYRILGGGIYYTSGVLDRVYQTRIDADEFLIEYNKGRIIFI